MTRSESMDGDVICWQLVYCAVGKYPGNLQKASKKKTTEFHKNKRKIHNNEKKNTTSSCIYIYDSQLKRAAKNKTSLNATKQKKNTQKFLKYKRLKAAFISITASCLCLDILNVGICRLVISYYLFLQKKKKD